VLALAFPSVGYAQCKMVQERGRICKGDKAWKDGFLLSEKAVAAAKRHREDSEKKSVIIKDYQKVLDQVQDQRDRAKGNATALEKALARQNARTASASKLADKYRKIAASRHTTGEVVLVSIGSAGAGILVYILVRAFTPKITIGE
jgi:hypothetical protein